MTEPAAPDVTDEQEKPPADVWMNHPDSEGHARTTRAAFDQVWAPKGWVESSAEAVRLTEETGSFVREAPSAASGPDQEATDLGAADAARSGAEATPPTPRRDRPAPLDAPLGDGGAGEPQG